VRGKNVIKLAVEHLVDQRDAIPHPLSEGG
jgi:hypothetical protein